MKTISTTAIVALMTATLGLSAIAPASAQQAAPPAPQAQEALPLPPPAPGEGRPGFPGGPGMRHGGGLEALFSFEGGAEAIDVALVRLGYRLDLTDAQKDLLATLKTSALGAATDFATATESLRPTPPAEGETAALPDVSARLESRIAMEKAHLAALEAIQPAFTAFFDSLTDAQKARLMPERPAMGEHGPGHGNGGWDRKGPGFGHHQGKDQPGTPPAPAEGAAPDAAPAPGAETDAPAPAVRS